jgi:hypothetical protein
MLRRHLALLGAVACLVTASCSTDESPPSNSPELGGTVGVPPVDDSNVPAPPPLTPGEDDTVLDTVPLGELPGNGELGSCNVTVSGGATAAWRADATVESVSYGPWFDDATRQQAAVDSVVLDASYLVLMCRDAGEQSIGFTATAAVPQRASTYRLAYDADGTVPSPRNRFDVAIGLDGIGLCRLAGDSVLDLTGFDDDHIAGTFDIAARCATGATVRAVGSFDFANPQPFLTPPPDTTG